MCNILLCQCDPFKISNQPSMHTSPDVTKFHLILNYDTFLSVSHNATAYDSLNIMTTFLLWLTLSELHKHFETVLVT